MSMINEIRRKKIRKNLQSALQNKNFSIIASNCNGGVMYHDLNLPFLTPFINLWLYPKDFIRFLQDMEHYLQTELTFIKKEDVSYPVGKLDDIEIYFQHYQSEEEAKEKWIERSKRIQFDQIFVIMTDRDGCTMEDLIAFDQLPWKNKVVFTHLPYPDLASSYYLPGFEDQEQLGQALAYLNKFSGKRYYDSFPFVDWFNGKDIEKK